MRHRPHFKLIQRLWCAARRHNMCWVLGGGEWVPVLRAPVGEWQVLGDRGRWVGGHRIGYHCSDCKRYVG